MLYLHLRSSNITIARSINGTRMEEKNYNVSEFRRLLIKFNKEEVIVYSKHLDIAQSYTGIETGDEREIAMYDNSEI